MRSLRFRYGQAAKEASRGACGKSRVLEAVPIVQDGAAERGSGLPDVRARVQEHLGVPRLSASPGPASSHWNSGGAPGPFFLSDPATVDRAGLAWVMAVCGHNRRNRRNPEKR